MWLGKNKVNNKPKGCTHCNYKKVIIVQKMNVFKVSQKRKTVYKKTKFCIDLIMVVVYKARRKQHKLA